MMLPKTAIAAALGALALSACQQPDPQPGADDAAAPTAEDAGAGAAAASAPLVRAADDPALQWGPCPDIFPQGCELTIVNGDPAQPNADALLRVPGGYAIPAHSHSSAERMVLVDGVLEVKYQGAPAAVLREGSYAYGPPGLPHSATCRSSEPCVLFIAFVDPVDAKPFEGELE